MSSLEKHSLLPKRKKKRNQISAASSIFFKVKAKVISVKLETIICLICSWWRIKERKREVLEESVNVNISLKMLLNNQTSFSAVV